MGQETLKSDWRKGIEKYGGRKKDIEEGVDWEGENEKRNRGDI